MSRTIKPGARVEFRIGKSGEWNTGTLARAKGRGAAKVYWVRCWAGTIPCKGRDVRPPSRAATPLGGGLAVGQWGSKLQPT